MITDKPKIGERYRVYEFTNHIANRGFAGKTAISPRDDAGGNHQRPVLLLHPDYPRRRMFRSTGVVRPIARLTVKGIRGTSVTDFRKGDRVRLARDKGWALSYEYTIGTVQHVGTKYVKVLWEGGAVGFTKANNLFKL